MSSGEQIIELSVEETNKLRAKLGLAPLRGVGNRNNNDDKEKQGLGSNAAGGDGSNNNTQQDKEVLELSVDETNALRAKLGLAPLRAGGSRREIIHAPAANEGESRAAAERIERARIERQVQDGIAQFTSVKTLAEEDEGALAWAKRMRQSSKQEKEKEQKQKKSEGKKDDDGDDDEKDDDNEAKKYDEEDLKGLRVAHALSDLQEGSTTVLTLADTTLLKTADDTTQKVVGLNDDEEDAGRLENVNLAEQQRQRDGLREKRKLELGMGRAGGYSGFDDDEFEELGGTQAPSRSSRFAAAAADGDSKKKKKDKLRGFQIGILSEEEQAENESSDLFAFQQGKAISLEPSSADVIASDFMTIDEEEAERAERKLRKEKKKKEKEFKKKKKKDKKKQKKHRRATADSDEEEDGDEDLDTKKADDIMDSVAVAPSSKGLLEELEATADQQQASSASRRKRRRTDDDDDGDNDKKAGTRIKVETVGSINGNGHVDGSKGTGTTPTPNDVDKSAAEKRAKFEAVMAKGNERTKLAFEQQPKKKRVIVDDEEPDDAFLNAALAKARRLNRLKKMAAESATTSRNEAGQEVPATQAAKGAEAVIQSIQSAQAMERPGPAPSSSGDGAATGGTITFSVDETTEFTRALRARAEQVDRNQAKKAAAIAARNKEITSTAQASTSTPKDGSGETNPEPVTSSKGMGKQSIEVAVKQENGIHDGMDVDEEEEDGKGPSLAELAKEVKDEPEGALDGATGARAVMGRGLGSVLGLLQQTGELTRKNAGKEEMRGRAKDKRTYEDYEPLDLSKVVKIDERTATDKDKELAHREVKLEYRDKHGRLLTRKEAFRDLSYQFHGHGSGKRKEAKRNEQIAREQAEARMASRQAGEGAGVGTFGALKATQKATGKAFVVHKT